MVPYIDLFKERQFSSKIIFKIYFRQLQWKFRDIITPSEWWTEAKPHLTIQNVYKLGKFLIVLLLAAFSGLGHFILNTLSHTNRFVHALSGLMRTTTPILLAVVDAVNRFIGMI